MSVFGSQPETRHMVWNPTKPFPYLEGFFTFDLTRDWLKNEGANVVCNRLMPCEKNDICSWVLQLHLAALRPDMGTLPEYSDEKAANFSDHVQEVKKQVNKSCANVLSLRQCMGDAVTSLKCVMGFVSSGREMNRLHMSCQLQPDAFPSLRGCMGLEALHVPPSSLCLLLCWPGQR